jgi:hypothetical protein
VDYVEVFDNGLYVLEAREALVKVVWKCVYVHIIIFKTNTYFYTSMCYFKSLCIRWKGIKPLTVSISAASYEYCYVLKSGQ